MAAAGAAARQKLPLEGVRVLELSHIVAGPSGGAMLGDLGADVIKIEHPASGDTARSQSNGGQTFFSFNRNKQFLALDLRKAGGKKVFEKLVAQADVVLDNSGDLAALHGEISRAFPALTQQTLAQVTFEQPRALTFSWLF